MVRGKKLVRKLAVQRNIDSYGEMSFPTSPKVANVKYKIFFKKNEPGFCPDGPGLLFHKHKLKSCTS